MLYGLDNNVPLDQFASRPVKLYEIIWTLSVPHFDAIIDPWAILLNDALLRRRIEGYRLFRADLALRIVINGNPFMYGGAFFSYFPRMTKNHFGRPSSRAGKACEASMLPYQFISPTTSGAYEMRIPFISPNNWIDLLSFNKNDMGRLLMRTINPLLHANATSGSAQITIFGWFENVQISVPTARDYGVYDLQAGELYPEQGIVSRPASAIADAAGVMARIPIIRPYALATQMAASALAGVAKLFGFSRPSIMENITRVKGVSLGQLAVADQSETVQKLTLDSRAELSIDSRIVGFESSRDEMAIESIVTKEAYANTIAWSSADTDGTLLNTIVVNPMYYVVDSYTNTQADNLVNLPIATVASNFRYWRGGIKYRFQIIASAMHRGRLKVTYEPYFISSDPAFNQDYVKVVDISDCREFDFTVNWHNSRGWLKTGVEDLLNPPSAIMLQDYTGSALPPFLANGTLRVSIVNALTSPNPLVVNNVYVNVYISAMPDFEVADPDDFAMRRFTYTSQSGELPTEDTKISMGAVTPSIPNSDPSYFVYFGDKVSSIRSLMKRYCYHSIFGAANGSPFWWREFNFPYYPGKTNTAGNGYYRHNEPTLTGPYTINYCANTPINWFTPCFLAWRGSLRSKFVYPGNAMVALKRGCHSTGIIAPGTFTTFSGGVDSDNAFYFLKLFSSALSGMAAVDTSLDGALEIEFPFHSHHRFSHGRSNQYTYSLTEQPPNVLFHQGVVIPKDSSNKFGILRFVAIGDDFSLSMFIGQPLLHYGTILADASELPGPPFDDIDDGNPTVQADVDDQT